MIRRKKRHIVRSREGEKERTTNITGVLSNYTVVSVLLEYSITVVICSIYVVVVEAQKRVLSDDDMRLYGT